MADQHKQPLGLQFPCEFPIKIFVREDADFVATAREIVERHTGSIADDQVARRPSKNAKFVALTFTVTARSRAQLDEIYTELTARKEVLMAL